MIQQLNPDSFRQYGIILPENAPAPGIVNSHSICLLSDVTSCYQASADTCLLCKKGLTVLSVSPDGGEFTDFYLDKAVTVRRGTWFSLTPFRGAAEVALSAVSLPRLVETHAARLELSTRPKLQITELYTLFYQQKEPGFVFSGEAHPMLELTYVDKGVLHSVADGTDLALRQGEMALYGPNQWHMQYADMETAVHYVTVSFDLTGCDLSGLYNRILHPSGEVLTLMQRLLREQEHPLPHWDDMTVHLLEILLLSLLREADNTAAIQAPHSLSGENQIIRRAQQYVSAHVYDKLSVPLVAKNTRVSASYLTALFHKHLQLSPGEYIRRIKLQQSKQLIREGKLNFTEISQTLQYSTVHHFSRQFKEKFGITPSEYAKSVK